MRPYSQHFIFFVTSMLRKTRLEKLASNRHSNLMGLFVNYDENELLWK